MSKTKNPYYDNPFLIAQERALQITYIPKEIRSVFFKENRPKRKKQKKIKIKSDVKAD